MPPLDFLFRRGSLSGETARKLGKEREKGEIPLPIPLPTGKTKDTSSQERVPSILKPAPLTGTQWDQSWISPCDALRQKSRDPWQAMKSAASIIGSAAILRPFLNVHAFQELQTAKQSALLDELAEG